MKILLLGANGQVGFELARSLAPLGELYPATRDGYRPSRVRCLVADLADPQMLGDTLHDVAPDIVVNAAAYTAVDRAEDDEGIADAVNRQSLVVLGSWAARSKALVVHYSTDYVFDGQGSRPYREDDATAPLGVYGRSKLAGEQALRESGCDHLIFRTAWVYAARGQNFLRTMLRLAGERDQVRIVDDQRGAPTPARLIASATALALARWLASDASRRAETLGTYHLCAQGECTWYEFARSIFQRADSAVLIGHKPAIFPITTAEYPTRARRPAYSVLDTKRIRETFGLHLPPWEEGLDAVIGELATMQSR
ncbi:MAG: dTDP-4-dehydrorhamnose reductase [Rudaea sp.]|nr:dTDP-4-dehydrorhamnose reductase [Rudaea sp.]